MQRTVEDAPEPDVAPVTRPLLGAGTPEPTSTPVARTPVRATGLLPTVSRSSAPDAPPRKAPGAVSCNACSMSRGRDPCAPTPPRVVLPSRVLPSSGRVTGSGLDRLDHPEARLDRGPAMKLAAPACSGRSTGRDSSCATGERRLDHRRTRREPGRTRRAASGRRGVVSTSSTTRRPARQPSAGHQPKPRPDPPCATRASRAAGTRRGGVSTGSTTRRPGSTIRAAGASTEASAGRRGRPAPLVQRALVGEWSRQARPPGDAGSTTRRPGSPHPESRL